MGFPEIRAKRALLKTGNTGAESAMDWLFAHMDDTGKLSTRVIVGKTTSLIVIELFCRFG